MNLSHIRLFRDETQRFPLIWFWSSQNEPNPFFPVNCTIIQNSHWLFQTTSQAGTTHLWRGVLKLRQKLKEGQELVSVEFPLPSPAS